MLLISTKTIITDHQPDLCQKQLACDKQLLYANDLGIFKHYNANLLICPFLTPHFLVMAVQSVANIVKSSLGPVGLDKMIVDDIGVC